MIEIGGFRLDLIDDGRFELKSTDFTGGSTATKKKPRVMIGFNSLLIRGNGHTVLVDPGTGDKLLDDRYRHYRLEWPRKVFGELDRLGVSFESVDTVVLTHLHWDHCGAATRLNENKELIPTFPKARYVVQKRELEAARWALMGGDDGYIPDDFEPLDSAGVLEAIDGDVDILPGIRAEWVGGHSAGLQVIFIGNPGEGMALYLSDLIPTSAQLAPDAGMSYDQDSQELRRSKGRILDRAIQEHMLLLFVHAPRSRAGYVSRKDNGELAFERVSL